MAVAVIVLFTVLPLVLLVVDIVRPRKDVDAFAGPARTSGAAPAAPVTSLARTSRRNDFFGDRTIA